MPNFTFFRNLGLFAEEGFLDSETCLHVREQISAAETKKGVIVGNGAEEGVIDEEWRKVLCAQVDKATLTLVEEKLLAIRPRLEKHFGMSLDGCDGPVFLRYGKDAFFKPHRDSSYNSPSDIRKRRVSAIIFLNSASNEGSQDGYGGGALTFYGLLEGPQWEKCGFALDVERGLFIAFRPETLHEVQAVTFGERYTVVNWFTTTE